MTAAIDLQRRADTAALVGMVAGVRLWEELGDGVVRDLVRRLGESGILVIRRQSLSETELLRVASLFGEMEPSIRYDWASPYNRGVGYISNMRNPEGKPIGGLGSNEVVWHTDQSYLPRPVTGAMLYCVETPPEAGRTSWANLTLAYEALPAAMKRRIEDYVTVFSYAARAKTYEEKSRPNAEMSKMTPPVEHRLVNAHPRTGRKALYLDPGTSTHIVGLPQGESDALLAELHAHAIRPEFVYTHEWQVGDLVVWDNAATLHRREPLDTSQSRLLKRLQFRLPASDFICPG